MCFIRPFSDSPVLWIRIDPDMQLIRSLDIQQPDFQWQYQLRHERDVTAQSEAVVALEHFPSPASTKALADMIENEKCFYKIRCEATHCLARVANAMAPVWDGPPPMLTLFKKTYGSFTASHIIKQNDFSNLVSYFLQKVSKGTVVINDNRNFHLVFRKFRWQSPKYAMLTASVPQRFSDSSLISSNTTTTRKIPFLTTTTEPPSSTPWAKQ